MWLINFAEKSVHGGDPVLHDPGTGSPACIPVDILPFSRRPAVQVITYFQGMPASSIEKDHHQSRRRWVNQRPSRQGRIKSGWASAR